MKEIRWRMDSIAKRKHREHQWDASLVGYELPDLEGSPKESDLSVDDELLIEREMQKAIARKQEEMAARNG